MTGVRAVDLFTCDVLVVGGGGAGLRAAIEVAETHPRLRVAVISKVYPMRSHTVSAEGGAAAVIKAGDSLDAHAYDTISGGDWLTDQDAVEAFVAEAPKEMLRLEHWGCPWSREPDGHVAVRPFGGMKIERTWFAADKTGFHLLHTLFQTTLKYEAIERYDEFFVTKLLVEDGRCQGVVAVELGTGQIRAITARAVIKPNDSLDDHAKDTITGSDWLADQDAVEAFVKEAPGEMIQLEHWGCPWSREPNGQVAVRPFGGMKIQRTWFAADKTGFHMLHALFQTSQKYNNVTRYDEWFATRLLVDDGRVQGVTAIELRTGLVKATSRPSAVSA